MHDLGKIYRTWRHRDGANYYFDPAYAQELIERYNRVGDEEALNNLLMHVEPLARSILEYRCTMQHETLDEFMSRIRIKLWRSLRLYDPVRGTAFSFCAKVISSTAASIVGETWMRTDRFTVLSEAEGYCSPCEFFSREAIAEIEHKARRVKTSCTNPFELKAQHWFVESFIDAGFKLRRHEAADAVMQVFGLTHSRSRQLFDVTMVAIRREFLVDRRISAVSPVSLRHTKIAALIRYARYLSGAEFSRLAVLMRDVAPSVIFTVHPVNTAAIRRNEPGPIRSNLELVLYGAPTDRGLYASI